MEIFTDPIGYKKWYELHEKIYESERNLVSQFKPTNCLDIGSGPGIFHEVFSGRIISLDISIFMLKQLGENEDKILADAHYLPIRDKSLECAFISVTICFLSNIEDFYKEISRVLKGRVITCFVPRDSPWGEHYYELGLKGHKYYSYANFIKKKELYDILKKYFEIVKVKSTLFITPSEGEKVDKIEDNDNGSFVCIEAKAK
ncbi:methyltransferase domain-containing protein [Sulfurisphaera javensis]|uniref:Methyltransferase domain-containing protein n=1 Tax=Sulfurisphaera javensis TaxID=2049879 RepID=A0AAT9GP87_9CREN